MADSDRTSAQSDHTDGVATVGMGHRAHARRTALTEAVLAATLSAALSAGCSGDSRDDGRSPHPSTLPSPALPSPALPSPHRSTAAGSPLAVKIDNVPAARPQTGLAAADVVYVEPVEGGLSRLMAVYATKLPETVGPVRSARESDLELLRQFHRPTLAFSGARRGLLPLIDQAPLRARSPDQVPGAYHRGTAEPAPHNLYLRPAALLPAAPGEAALTTGFRYGPLPPGGTPVTERTVRYPAARFTFTWSAGRGGWLVAMDGDAAVTREPATAGTDPTGTAAAGQGRLAPATVVVQYVEIRTSRYHDVLGNHTPYPVTVGSGEAEVLRDGRSFDASWSRPAATDGTAFTAADGSPLDFAAGQVWVVLAPAT